ncbi:hypothetical protein FRC03_002981 [Tulasnella sp. 419]|nr:hypothetical protein FRC03_002981 [Tulasnella sp. 419]
MAKSKTSGKAASQKTSAGVTYYLVAYNLVSALLWSVPLAITLIHLTGIDISSWAYKPWYVAYQSWLARLPFGSTNASSSGFYSLVPQELLPYLLRSKATYNIVGTGVKWVQTGAILEVVHSLLGWVRSPLQTTLMQVYSRLFVVWAIVDQFPNTRSNPLYTSMILAWCITEVIRYIFYAFNLLGINFYPLLWLRYTTFYFLYPIGASSEAFLIFATLPIAFVPDNKSSQPTIEVRLNLSDWQPFDYYRGAMFLIWWPSLYMLYTHMIAQRRKVLGSQGKTLGTKKTN